MRMVDAYDVFKESKAKILDLIQDLHKMRLHLVETLSQYNVSMNQSFLVSNDTHSSMDGSIGSTELSSVEVESAENSPQETSNVSQQRAIHNRSSDNKGTPRRRITTSSSADS